MAIMSDVHCEYCILMTFMNCRPVDQVRAPTEAIPMAADGFDIHQSDWRWPVRSLIRWPEIAPPLTSLQKALSEKLRLIGRKGIRFVPICDVLCAVYSQSTAIRRMPRNPLLSLLFGKLN
jgi:hypothetical protein